MDKRTVLAVVLIFLVYVGSMWFIQVLAPRTPPPADPSGVNPTATSEGPAGGDEQRASDSAAASGAATTTLPSSSVAASDQDAAGQTGAAGDPLRFVPPTESAAPVEVTTDLYVVRIDPEGARITSWEGLRFEGPTGGPVRLIDADGGLVQEGQGGQLRFQRGDLDLSRAVFTAEGPPVVGVEAGGEARSVVFAAQTETGLIVRKTFTFHPGRYDIDVDLQLLARDGQAAASSLRLLGEPLRARFAWTAGIASTERNKKMEQDSFRAFALTGDELAIKNRRGLAGGEEKVRGTYSGSVRFAGLQNKYFLIAGLVPDSAQRAVEGTAHLDGDRARGQQTWWLEVPLFGPPAGSRGASAAEGSAESLGSARLALYIGPSEIELLKAYGVGLERSIDLGWKIFAPLAEAVLWFMNWSYRWLPNYGLIIILLGVVTKVLFYPLTLSSTRSMKKLQEVAPRIKALQEKYKGNQQKLGEEMMKIYREEKINPMGGCLPLLLQMPVFIALYQALRGSIALRQAPFFAWIDDLAQPDALFQLPFSIPFLGDSFNLLPILMAVSTYYQTKLTPQAPTAGPSMAMMNKLMPVMMLFFFYTFPSGLVLYWLVNNLLSIYQSWRIQRTTPVAGGVQA